MNSPFKKPTCAGCGDDLPPEDASYESRSRVRRYCSTCAPVGELKENWKPVFGASSIRAIYTIDEKGKTVPYRQPNMAIVQERPAKEVKKTS